MRSFSMRTVATGHRTRVVTRWRPAPLAHATRGTHSGAGFTLSTLLSSAASLSSMGAATHPRDARTASPPHPSTAAALQLNLPPLFTWGAGGPDALCDSLAAFVDPLLLHARHPPSLLVLRLFPDTSVALLSRPVAPAAGGRPSQGLPQRQPQGHRSRRTPAHRLPLEAFVAAEQPWGAAGPDPQAAFAVAVGTLERVLQRFAGVPVLLVWPTRMLVSQVFCEQLLARLRRARSGRDGSVVGLALELPSTAMLYEPDRAAVPAAAPGESESFSWARLPLLTTPWSSLLRCDRYAAALAHPLRHQLRRHTLMPLHVLVPWLLSESMFEGLEVSLVVDTVPPSHGAAYARAATEGPDSFPVGLHAPEYTRGQAESSAQVLFLRDSPRAGGGGDRAGVYAAATDALRRQRDTDTSVREGGPDLERVTAAVRAKAKATTPAPRRVDEVPLLTLDAPPDTLRQLILNSILSDPVTATVEAAAGSGDAQHGDAPCGGVMTRSRDHRESQECEARGIGEGEGRGIEEMLLRGARGVGSTGWLTAMQEAMARELAALQAAERTGESAAVDGSCESDSQGGGEGDGSDAVSARLRAWAGEAEGALDGRPSAISGANAWAGVRDGYWRSLVDLAGRLRSGPPRVSAVTMPTYHAKQVADWSHVFRRVTAEGSQVLAMAMPVLSPAALEGQRLLREGTRVGRSHESGTGNAGPGASRNRWLPTPLQRELEAALAALPESFRECESRRAPAEYQRAMTAVREGEGGDGGTVAGAAAAVVVEGVPHGSAEDDGGQAGAASVVIRRSHRARPPLWYDSPTSLAAQHTARVSAAQSDEPPQACADAHTGDNSEESCSLVARSIRQVEADFEAQVMRGAVETMGRGADAVGLALPPPGVSDDVLALSWQALRAPRSR